MWPIWRECCRRSYGPRQHFHLSVSYLGNTSLFRAKALCLKAFPKINISLKTSLTSHLHLPSFLYHGRSEGGLREVFSQDLTSQNAFIKRCFQRLGEVLDHFCDSFYMTKLLHNHSLFCIFSSSVMSPGLYRHETRTFLP